MVCIYLLPIIFQELKSSEQDIALLDWISPLHPFYQLRSFIFIACGKISADIRARGSVVQFSHATECLIVNGLC